MAIEIKLEKSAGKLGAALAWIEKNMPSVKVQIIGNSGRRM